ncbi:MAG: hypothetical protein HY052_07765 [Proteobacteria bacterium]|nr:hypothetical protein [Pseudomonadota bacterium]
MKRRTVKIIGAGLLAAGMVTMPFNAVAAAVLFASGGFTAGIVGAKRPQQDKPEPPTP